MENADLFLREDYPPRAVSPKRNITLRPPAWIGIETVPPVVSQRRKKRILFPAFVKIILFAAIFIFSFHLHCLTLGVQDLPSGLWFLTSESRIREQTIREIVAVLERYPTGLVHVTREELAEVIYDESVRNNHDPKFILALIKIESSFQNWSVSEQGAKGLMQIMPYVAESLAKELGIEWSGDRTLFNPFLNIKIGIHYLSRLIEDFNDLGLALTAYNYGPTYVKSLMERKEEIPQNFYQRILTVYQTI
jgi:soluble lytic murein transglycosylase